MGGCRTGKAGGSSRQQPALRRVAFRRATASQTPADLYFRLANGR
jgi:hypothetical protein